jgi:plastocyanin
VYLGVGNGKGDTMVRRLSISAGLGLLLALALPAISAAGGGGCHTGATQGTGTAVTIADACFGPTILHIDPGQSVTWTNTDPFVHNVTANSWGHFDDLLPGKSFTATFQDAGVYPYACTYHPGMSGAVVVGDGLGAGSGQTVAVGADAVSSPVAPAVTQAASSGSGSLGAWIGGIALGIALSMGLVLVLRRRGPEAPV